MSAFCTMRRASLPSISVAAKPGVPFPTTKPFTEPSPRSRAQMMIRSANVPFPIHRLAPLRTQRPPSRRAVVSSPPATSDPPCGSVSTTAAISPSRAIGGSQRCFCSSEPQRLMLPMASPVCTPKNEVTDGTARAISKDRNPVSSRVPRCAASPSYISPAMSSLRNPSMSWNGNSALAQYSLAIGSTSAARKSRTRATMSRSGSDSRSANPKKSLMPPLYPRPRPSPPPARPATIAAQPQPIAQLTMQPSRKRFALIRMGIYARMAHKDVRAGLSRRGFLAGAAALGAGLVTAGCAGTYDVGSGITGSSGGDNNSTLVYWNLLTGGDGTHMVAMEDAFRKAYPKVDLESTILAWGAPYYTKLSLAIRSASPPDVAIMHLSPINQYGPPGMLTPISLDLLAAHGMEPKDFTPLAFSKAHYNGQLLCLPLDTHPFVQYYNTKVCKKAGLLDSSGTLPPIKSPDAML